MLQFRNSWRKIFVKFPLNLKIMFINMIGINLNVILLIGNDKEEYFSPYDNFADKEEKK